MAIGDNDMKKFWIRMLTLAMTMATLLGVLPILAQQASVKSEALLPITRARADSDICAHSENAEHDYVGGICTACGDSVLGITWYAPDFPQGDYTMIAIPDTQNQVQYWPDVYFDTCQWIADNKTQFNIQAVFHMGDMVNNNKAVEWSTAVEGMQIIENSNIPWMPMRGNHDDSAGFNQYFDYKTYGTDQSWFGGSYHKDKLDHTYWFVTVENREYLILSLGWAPSWDVLSWAQKIVEANQDKNVILNCHAYMDKDGSLLSKGDTHCVSSYPGLSSYPDGQDVWVAFKDYDNVVLAMGGHIPSPDIVTYTDKNGAGENVTSMLIDCQNTDYDTAGMLAIFTFHSNTNTVEVNWYSTKYDALLTQKNQFSINVPHISGECKHTYNSVVTPPTCTEKGYTTHTCACGDSFVDTYVDANGHSFGAWNQIVSPTCTKQGEERRDCENCDHYETRSVQPTGHNYNSVVTLPTCIQQGYTTHTCACGDSFVDTYVNVIGHTFDDDEDFYCNVCGTPRKINETLTNAYEEVISYFGCASTLQRSIAWIALAVCPSLGIILKKKKD